jgi:hypothetical protein
METYRPKNHREINDIRRLAEVGSSLKVREAYENGDLASLTPDEAQRILSLALEKSLEYSEERIIPMTDNAFKIQHDQIEKQENRLIRLNFRTRSLEEVVKSFHNDV